MESAEEGSPDSARTRILAAAGEEFAAKGFAGARVNTIAERARVNKQLLYYYFDSKRGLYQAVRQHLTLEIQRVGQAAPRDLADRAEAFAKVAWSPEMSSLTRMNQWASLEGPGWDGPIGKETLSSFVRQLDRDRAEGKLAQELDPDLVLVALIA